MAVDFASQKLMICMFAIFETKMWAFAIFVCSAHSSVSDWETGVDFLPNLDGYGCRVTSVTQYPYPIITRYQMNIPNTRSEFQVRRTSPTISVISVIVISKDDPDSFITSDWCKQIGNGQHEGPLPGRHNSSFDKSLRLGRKL